MSRVLGIESGPDLNRCSCDRNQREVNTEKSRRAKSFIGSNRFRQLGLVVRFNDLHLGKVPADKLTVSVQISELDTV